VDNINIGLLKQRITITASRSFPLSAVLHTPLATTEMTRTATHYTRAGLSSVRWVTASLQFHYRRPKDIVRFRLVESLGVSFQIWSLIKRCNFRTNAHHLSVRYLLSAPLPHTEATDLENLLCRRWGGGGCWVINSIAWTRVFCGLMLTEIAARSSFVSRWQWPCGLGLGCSTDRLLGLRVRIPPRAWMCLLWVLCAVRSMFLRQTDHPSREIPPSMVCLSVIVKFRQWGGPAH
jgi:hypothetical protein